MKKSRKLFKKVASKTFSFGIKPATSKLVTKVYTERINTLHNIESIFQNMSANFIEMAKAMDITSVTFEKTKEDLKQQINDKQRSDEEASLEKNNLKDKMSSKLLVPVAGQSSSSLFDGISNALQTIIDVLGASAGGMDLPDGTDGRDKKKGKRKPKGKGKTGKLGKAGKFRIPPGAGKALSVGGRILGAAGLVSGAYEASEFLKETDYGSRMAKGEGKLAEKAFREKKTDFSSLPLSAQEAQNILDGNNPKDIEVFGGKERLEKIAGLKKPEVVTTQAPKYNFPDTGVGGGRGRVHPEFVKSEVAATFTPSQLKWLGNADPTDPAILARMPLPLPGEVGGPQEPQIQVAAAKPPIVAKPPEQQAVQVAKPTVTGNIPQPEETVYSAIKKASEKVGTDESIMLAMAKQESGFNPNAKAGTSSAKGLYQFLDSTWNGMVNKYGKAFPELLKGPLDALASSIAGALYIKENATFLKKNNIPVTGTTIYASHFLGPGGARKLLQSDPNTIAASIPGMEGPANANKFIFFKPGSDKKPDLSTPRTVAEVTEVLYKKVGQTAEQYAAIAGNNTSGSNLSTSSTIVASAKKQQSGQTLYNVNNSTTNVVNVGGAPQGGSITVARPVATA